MIKKETKKHNKKILFRKRFFHVLKILLPCMAALLLFTGTTVYTPLSLHTAVKPGSFQTASAREASPAPSVTPRISPTPAPKVSSVPTAQEVIDNARQDPSISPALVDSLQDALDRNPEIRPFIRNYFTADPVVKGGLREEEKKEPYPLFIQWDRRWGFVPYGDDTIGLSGCAPASLSMVLYSLTRDESATPDAIAAYSTENGYYVYGTGTAWELMTDIPEQYPVTAQQLIPTEEELRQHLDQGHMFIFSMGPGDFTEHGHLIVVYDYDDTGFLVNDPFSHANSEKTWTYQVLQGQIKNGWVYSLTQP